MTNTGDRQWFWPKLAATLLFDNLSFATIINSLVDCLSTNCFVYSNNILVLFNQ
jgi:hypothetical protein